jgi:hypothetical protein
LLVQVQDRKKGANFRKGGLNMRKTNLILLATLALGGSVTARDRSVPVATPLGTAQSCIQLHSIRESRVRSDKIIDFRTGANKWYRNELPHSCPSLGFEERFMYQTSLNQLCSVDIITVLHTSGSGLDRGASCGLGKFQPVTIAKK